MGKNPHFHINNVDVMWSKVNVIWNIVEECRRFVDVMWNIVEECGCFVEKYGCFVDVMWNIVEECGCFVDVMWNIVEECGCLMEKYGCFMDIMWNIVEEYGCFMEKCGYNMDPPHLHISQFDQVLSPPWSVILKYAIADVMWTFHISTMTIKWTADLFCTLYSQCICYQSLGLVSGVSMVPELRHCSITSA